VYFDAFPPVCYFTFPLVYDNAAIVSCSGGAFSQTGAWLASGVPFPGSCSGKNLQLYCVTPASAFWGLRIFDDVTPSGGCSQVVVSDCMPFFATWDDLVVGGANFSGGCGCSGIAQIFFTNDPTPPF